MKNQFRGALLVSAMLLVSAGHAYAAGIPAEFLGKNPSRSAPIWVSATVAIAADGNLISEKVAPAEHQHLARMLEKATQRVESKDANAQPVCDVTIAQYSAEGPDNIGISASWEDLAALTARSSGMYEGTVTATDVGLHDGIPFTVARLELVSSRVVYVLFPLARVRMNGITLCTADPSFAGLPPIGARLMFIAGPPIDKAGKLYRVAGEHLFYEIDTVLVAPPRFAHDKAFAEVHSLESLKSRLRTRDIQRPREK